ncbi:MAG: hypothetical protein K6B41_10685 [Butyrivibrio sp.]|nr:hypothetical protein [Butyrivibrio sp.]
MSDKKARYDKALNGKNLPILTTDEKWHYLFQQTSMPDDVKKLADELDALLDKQSSVREDIKKVKRLKKKLLSEIVPLRDKASKLSGKKAQAVEKEIADHTRLINDCNDKIEDFEDDLLDLPREIYQADYKLMLATMEVCYARLHKNSDEIMAIDEWLGKIRVQLKKNVIRMQEREIENYNLYSYMHQIFGPEVIDIFDLKYDPEKRHPLRAPDGSSQKHNL